MTMMTPTPRSLRSSGASTRRFAPVLCACFSIGALHASPAHADRDPGRYPQMAAVAAYRIASAPDEIALARSAAPASISGRAEVLVLGDKGYETAVRGDNGFVCVVERSWANEFADSDFWNPKLRAPICFNRAAAHSVLSSYLQRTEWILAGASKADVAARVRAAVASGKIAAPDPGAMCYMMSRNGYLGDAAAGPWHPHLMFFLPRTDSKPWGANLPGSPLIALTSDVEPVTVVMSVVPRWSDGTQDSGGAK